MGKIRLRSEVNFYWLLIAGLIDSLGQSFIWPLATVYLHDSLHKSLVLSGIVLFFNCLGILFGSYIGGLIFDKSEHYKITILVSFYEVLVMFLLIYFNGWPFFGIGLFLIGLGSGFLLTIINSLATTVSSKNNRIVFNMLYFMQNIGVVIGTMLVGLLYNFGIKYLFITTTIIYAVFLIIVIYQFNVSRSINKTKTINSYNDSYTKNKVVIWTFLISIAVIWVAYEQWTSNMSVYMVSMHIALTKYSFLWTINGVLILIFQLLINFFVKKVDSLYFQIIPGLFAFAVSFLILLKVTNYWGFILSISILTMGEATAMPAIPALINELTSKGETGKYQGLFNVFVSLGRAVGPLCGGLIIEKTSYKFLFLLLSIVLFIVCFINLLVKKKFYIKV